MGNAILLATSLTQESPSVVDFKEYVICKPYLTQKDDLIVNECFKYIVDRKDKNRSSIRILDIGSGEGSLIRKIIYKLKKYEFFNNGFNIVIECLEPTDEGSNYLMKIKNEFLHSNIEINLIKLRIEDFLEKNTTMDKYDLILAIHSFYFINKQYWLSVIKKLMDIIRLDSKIIIGLVSRKSDIYNIYNQIDNEKLNHNYDRAFDEYGSYNFAEDLLDILLRHHEINYQTKNIIAPINFKESEGDIFYDAISNNYSKIRSSVIEFLAFMFRHTYNDMKVMLHLLQEKHFFKKKGAISFRSSDYIFEISGGDNNGYIKEGSQVTNPVFNSFLSFRL